MTKVKKYKLKENIKVNDILNNGFEYSVDCKYVTKFITLKGPIILYIKIPLDNIYSFDFYNNIDVLDDNFCQPYTPFYDNYNSDIVNNKYLTIIVNRYNEEMDKISIFEEIIN